MRISNTKELKGFLRANFNSLTDVEYGNILRETLGVYESKESYDVEEVIKSIDNHWETIFSYRNSQELPLFFFH
jgi:hypothetical protein